MKRHGLSMESTHKVVTDSANKVPPACPWFSHGLTMGRLWVAHGLPMGVKEDDELPMETDRQANHGLSMGGL